MISTARGVVQTAAISATSYASGIMIGRGNGLAAFALLTLSLALFRNLYLAARMAKP